MLTLKLSPHSVLPELTLLDVPGRGEIYFNLFFNVWILLDSNSHITTDMRVIQSISWIIYTKATHIFLRQSIQSSFVNKQALTGKSR